MISLCQPISDFISSFPLLIMCTQETFIILIFHLQRLSVSLIYLDFFNSNDSYNVHDWHYLCNNKIYFDILVVIYMSEYEIHCIYLNNLDIILFYGHFS